MTTPRSEKPLPAGRQRAKRSDALANRERVLVSAQELFAQDGPNASLDAIAQHAGVGNATVYRHFNSREELLATVLDRRLDLVEEYFAALGPIEDAWDALITYTRWLTDSPEPRLVLAVLLPPEGTPASMERRRRIRDTVQGLVERAQSDGKLRRPYGISDHNAFLYAHVRVSSEPGVAPETVARLLEIYLDGLRAR